MARRLTRAICCGFLTAQMGITPAADAAPVADTATRAAAAYDAADYDTAIDLWLGAGDYGNLSADVLYNLGNACYRLGSPGYAALYYHRTIERDPAHPEARQNLRFIQRKCGSLTVQHPEYQDTIARIPLRYWQGGVWAGFWLAGLALLIVPATRTGSRLRPVALAGLIAAPLIAAAGALGWYYFPDDAKFAPAASQAVIVADQVTLYTDASRTSPEVTEVPPGSLCTVIRTTGDWAYIAFATKTRGWVPITTLEPVIPALPPTKPNIRKPAVSERSA